MARRIGSPRTLCHGDFRIENLRFDADGVVAFDWQLIVLANGITDLAYFVGQSVRTAERAGHDCRILEAYLSALRAAGIDDDDVDDPWEIYPTAVLAMFIYPVSSTAGSPTSGRSGSAPRRRCSIAVSPRSPSSQRGRWPPPREGAAGQARARASASSLATSSSPRARLAGE